MIDNKKVIGICMTKIHDITRSETVDLLHREAEKYGYKLIVFNSSFDFYCEDDDDDKAASIYDFINYDIIDALIILCSGFINKKVFRKIIADAQAHNTPVILEDDIEEGCYTIRNSYEAPFKKLLNHVIRDHGRKNTFFIAGFPGSEPSEYRLKLYQEVLKENGLPFDNSMFDYGDYWEFPTYEVMDRLFASGKKLPDAIFCANDAMAVSVCQKLYAHGIRVPEDIIVTGFDGVSLADFSTPRITTCALDFNGFAEKCLSTADQIFHGISLPTIIHNDYKVRLSESCGCPEKMPRDYRSILNEYRESFTHMRGHEHFIYDKIHSQLDSFEMDINKFYNVLSSIMHEDSFLAIRPSFLTEATFEDNGAPLPTEELIIANKGRFSEDVFQTSYKFKHSDMIPDKEHWAKDHSIFVINSVLVGKMVVGYYEVRTNNIIEDGHKVTRVLNMTNMLSHMAVSSFRQRFFRIQKSKTASIDSLTELVNLHGLTKWFEEYTSQPQNQEMILVASIYTIPKYKYIYETHGIEAIESTVCFISEALRIANPDDDIIARIADDEFLVINPLRSESEIPSKIDNATAVFYSLLSQYNIPKDKSYYIQVNAGCVSSTVKEGLKLQTLIQNATIEMYKNIVLYGKLPAEKERTTSTKEEYHLFNTLISQNLFNYNFQPIVNARNGEIYGYEALMRTDQRIGLNPLEVLSIAHEYQRLYDIEKATIFNVMERYIKDYTVFDGKKIFVNCIPGHFLNEEDNEILREKYSEHIQNFVFEITEQNTVTNEELSTLRHIGNVAGTNSIAVDDYGVGHSNIVNLINYSPEIVKIDRFLMSEIDRDTNKQIVVKSVIEFARQNQIKVLAEGIETSAELQKAIELGVDYIQGYYTGRPVYDPITTIDDSVRAEILSSAGQLTS